MFSKNDLDQDMKFIYLSRGMNFDKDLKIKTYCDQPFRTVNVDKHGRVFLCDCQAWLPISIGHILDFNSFEEILQSPKALELQQSILDGSYRYCDYRGCGYENRLKNLDFLKEFKNENIPTSNPIKLVMGIDDSCNLTCPSCRSDFRFIKSGEDFDRRMKISDHLAQLVSKFEKNIQFEVSGDGDPFASLVYRNFLSKVKFNDPLSCFFINTNGILLKDYWEVVERIISNLSLVKISLDAGTEEVYNKTRRLGSWGKVIENLRWLIEYKKQNNYDFQVITNFVAQAENVNDIVTYYDLVSSMGVDEIHYQKVTDWGTWKNFSEHAVWMDGHPNYQTMVEQLKIVNQNKNVLITNLEPYVKT
jgi:wyosine [tRNA(Phe)-imidazoG37] synthetase (radical SAM superfamily)